MECLDLYMFTAFLKLNCLAFTPRIFPFVEEEIGVSRSDTVKLQSSFI